MKKIPAKAQDYFDNYWQFKPYEKVYKDDVNAKKITKQLRKEFGNIESLIDVGCATGHTILDFKKAGIKHVMGIEKYRLDPKRIPVKVRPYWINSDAKDIDKLFQPESFDVAFCNFFMYLSNREIRIFLEKLHPIVKEGFWLHYPFADVPSDDWVDKMSKKTLLKKREMQVLIEGCNFKKLTWDIWKKV